MAGNDTQDLYVDYVPEGKDDYPAVRFYDNRGGTGKPTGGKIELPEGGEAVFRRVDSPTAPFEFRDLSIYPVEVDRNALEQQEFNWYVDIGGQEIHLLVEGKQSNVQIYGYTLSLNDRANNRVVYRDPEVVNTGGGG